MITPYGGELTRLLVGEERGRELHAASVDWTSWDLTPRQLFDLELLLSGALSPLRGFLGSRDYHSVCREMRLADGTLWPLPVVLDVTQSIADQVQTGQYLALRDPEGVMLAALRVEEIWPLDAMAESESVYGTKDTTHPGVAFLARQAGSHAVSGRLEGLRLPIHYDFAPLRLTPLEARRRFAKRGWQRVVAFQTRNPMHRAHVELTRMAAADLEASLLIHPVVGPTRPGDIDHYTRVRCYRAVLEHYPQHTAMLALLPLAMRMGGPREALLHAIIRRNYGCTHFIVGRDHAGPGNDASGEPFYGPYEAQELMQEHQEELGIRMVPFKHLVYVRELDKYLPADEVPEGSRPLSVSGTELRSRLAEGRELPDWFTFPEVGDELRRTHPARHRRGFTVFFTGLSGAGKSTIANALRVKFLESGGRPVTLLDGDIVRKNLSSELGFSKEHRNINILRIGFVASEITKNGGIAICAPIAPYDAVRGEVREMIEPLGGFILVHVATPLDICESRDRKGLYAKARAGLIQEFTGISDVYEAPADAELSIDTSDLTPEEAAQRVLLYIERAGYLR